MGYSRDAGVVYGFAIGEKDTDIIELLKPLAEDEYQDDILSFGLDFKEFAKKFPDLSFTNAGYDGDDTYLIVYADESDTDLGEDGPVGAWLITDEKKGSPKSLEQLKAFSETYGIYEEPTWVAWARIM